MRVCLHKCTYATTFATSKHNCWHKAEGARTCRCKMANFSRRELDSFYTFCSPSLVPPFNPTYPPFLFLPYSSPNFLPRLFLPFTLPLLVSLVLVAVCQTRKATRFTRRFSRGIQNENKSNNQKGRVVSRLVKVCREENQRTLMREVIDCSFLSLFFFYKWKQSWREVALRHSRSAKNRKKSTGEKSLS